MNKITKFLALLTQAPYTTPFLPSRMQIIEDLLEQSHTVVIFLYMDGLYTTKQGQQPRNFENLEKKIDQWIQKYPDLGIYGCSRCAAARGFIPPKEIQEGRELFPSQHLNDKIQIVSINKLGKFLQDGFHLVQI